MSLPTPIHCRPDAFHLFASQLADLETTGGLLRAAVAVAGHELPDVDPAAVEGRLDRLARTITSRVSRGDQQALLAHLHDVLFEVEGFAGNTEDYYHPRNSYIPAVLETKRGIPVTLTLVYKCVAERVGLQVRGINAPGHFLATVEVNQSWMLVDPFYGGRLLTQDEAVAQVQQIGGPIPTPFSPANHRTWLGRILLNLQAIFVRSGRNAELRAMQELQALLQAPG